MKIVIELDESLTVGAYIEGVTKPSQDQCLALRNLAQVAGVWRHDLLGTGPEDDEPPLPDASSTIDITHLFGAFEKADEMHQWGNTATPDSGW